MSLIGAGTPGASGGLSRPSGGSAACRPCRGPCLSLYQPSIYDPRNAGKNAHQLAIEGPTSRRLKRTRGRRLAVPLGFGPGRYGQGGSSSPWEMMPPSCWRGLLLVALDHVTRTALFFFFERGAISREHRDDDSPLRPRFTPESTTDCRPFEFWPPSSQLRAQAENDSSCGLGRRQLRRRHRHERCGCRSGSILRG